MATKIAGLTMKARVLRFCKALLCRHHWHPLYEGQYLHTKVCIKCNRYVEYGWMNYYSFTNRSFREVSEEELKGALSETKQLTSE